MDFAKLEQSIKARHSELQMPWIESPYWEEILSDAGLSPDLEQQVRNFASTGILKLDPTLPDFDRLAQGIIRSLDGRTTTRLENAWEYCREVRELATAPAILQLLHVLYGRQTIPFQTLNFPVGTQQSVHSDCIHFQSTPSRYMCGVWFALEDVNADNGPLFYYPGSHKLPVINLDDLGLGGRENQISARYQIYERFMQRYVESLGLRREELYLKKGQAVIWAANLLHGGSPIRKTGTSRHSQVTHYFFEDCRYHAPLQSATTEGRMRFIEFYDIKSGKFVPSPCLPHTWPRRRTWTEVFYQSKNIVKGLLGPVNRHRIRSLLDRAKA
ncbi:phytanoyl-CoA dioxygenase family protein [Oligoflexus tunisiensis]|uniref:phytanoyl-CoA dioxygenase family protein n=1 Tax=Oligoflexus tunisiensis TaxID=708132 RepID=UPI000AD3E6D6|nr:phytanoyl-CoA dioxygenase family protein [Oligoflexus tunisiensis]